MILLQQHVSNLELEPSVLQVLGWELELHIVPGKGMELALEPHHVLEEENRHSRDKGLGREHLQVPGLLLGLGRVHLLEPTTNSRGSNMDNKAVDSMDSDMGTEQALELLPVTEQELGLHKVEGRHRQVQAPTLGFQE